MCKREIGMDRMMDVRKTVLVAEDVEINRMLLGTILEEEYDVRYASDGAETLIVLREEKDRISLLLLDLMMPEVDGMEVLRTMKSDPALRNIPVIVLTGDQEAEVECLHLGAMDFIPKPYPGAEIIQARVSKCIALSETRDLLQSTERDTLTKLFNIDYFVRYVERFDRYFAEMPMDAIVININHFQTINERFGKQYGDDVLRRLAD